MGQVRVGERQVPKVMFLPSANIERMSWMPAIGLQVRRLDASGHNARSTTCRATSSGETVSPSKRV